MKIVPDAMQAALDGRATTHARCWKVERRDGTLFGFTDHDRVLTIARQSGREVGDNLDENLVSRCV